MSANLPQQWFDRAAEDLMVAQLLLAEEYYSHTCFLSQQAIEKALKALLVHTTGAHPRTHRLVDLLTEAITAAPSLAEFLADCAIIDQYYIPTRYPDSIPGGLASGLPGKVEANEAVAIAVRLLAAVKSIMPAKNLEEEIWLEPPVEDE